MPSRRSSHRGLPARKLLAVLALSSLVTSGCAAAHGTEKARTSEPAPNLSVLKKAIIDYHDSGRWHADRVRTVRRARHYLEQRLKQDVREPAIVLDIDDTSLSTYGYELTHDFGYIEEEFDRYVLARRPTAIEPTRKLARFAESHGVAVFFVTGRQDDPGMREASAKDLREEGYPPFDGLYLRPSSDHRPSAVPYKTAARADIARQGYRIVLNIGDQHSDLVGGYSERTVKLPNPIYRTL